jgi:hypothetical protein
MITFFTTAKPFRGHSAIIQRNALKSWKLLHPDVEVILFGNDEGTSEVSREFGLRHEPEVARNAAGLPYMNAMFDRAHEISSHETLCYANCDIILTSDFPEAFGRVRKTAKDFLMIGRRWDTNITQPLDFSNPRWQEKVRSMAVMANDQRDQWWIDYFLFSWGLFYKKIPDFVVGRPSWDNWTVWKALHSGACVVDASAAVLAIHQNHGYSSHPQGRVGIWADESAKQNYLLAGSWRNLCKIEDATTLLTAGGIKPNWARHWYAAKRMTQLAYGHTKRVLIYDVWLPAWHFCLGMSRPIRARLGLRSKMSRSPAEKGSSQPRTLP